MPVQRRQTTRRMLELGHDIVNHSHRHLQPWGTIDWKTGEGLPTVAMMLPQINACRKAMRLIDWVSEPGGIRPFFRSPGDPSWWPRHPKERVLPFKLGAEPVGDEWPQARRSRLRFSKLLLAAQLANLRYVSFNLMAHDEGKPNGEVTTPEEVYGNVVNRRALVDSTDISDRSFELLPDAERRGAILLMHNGRQHTVDALPRVIRYLYDQGYCVRRIPYPLP